MRPLLIALVALFLSVAGCAGGGHGGRKHADSGRPGAVRREYASRSGVLVRLDAHSAEGRADAAITAGDVVCWLNGSTDQPVRIEVGAAVSEGCDTYGAAGFRVSGATTVTDPLVVPGGIASLAFPAAGTYSYSVTGLEAPVRGTIRVAAPPPPPTPESTK